MGTKTHGIPQLKKRNGSGIAQFEFEKAEEFNGQFSDVFTKSEYKQVPLMDRSAPFMHDIVVTKEGVTKLLKGLNPSKALEPDGPKGTGYGIRAGIRPSLPAVK